MEPISGHGQWDADHAIRPRVSVIFSSREPRDHPGAPTLFDIAALGKVDGPDTHTTVQSLPGHNHAVP